MEAESVEVSSSDCFGEVRGGHYQRGCRHGGHQSLRWGCAGRFREVGGLEEIKSGASKPNHEPLECAWLCVCKDLWAGLPGVGSGAERRPIIPSALKNWRRKKPEDVVESEISNGSVGPSPEPMATTTGRNLACGSHCSEAWCR